MLLNDLVFFIESRLSRKRSLLSVKMLVAGNPEQSLLEFAFLKPTSLIDFLFDIFDKLFMF